MKRHNNFYDTVDQIINFGIDKGILHLYSDDALFTGNIVHLNNKPVINFASCSYLGLEFEEDLKAGAKEAIDRYGTQFSESRAYVSIGLYKQLEGLLNKIFNAHCIITPTTTLGHRFSLHGRMRLLYEYGEIIFSKIIQKKKIELYRFFDFHVEVIKDLFNNLLKAEPVSTELVIFYKSNFPKG